jgi:hypothetical protein
MSLTARAQAKLAALVDSVDEARSLAHSTQRRIDELQHAVGNNPTGEGATDMRSELARLQGKMAEQQQRFRERSALHVRVRDWLRMIENKEIADAKLPKPKLAAGETHGAVVDRIRGELSRLDIEKRQVENCGLPKDELKAQARAWVTERALKGRPTIKASHASRFDVELATGGYTATPDIASFLCWHDEQWMVDRLCAEIDAQPNPPLALTPSEKAARLTDLKSKLLELERLEVIHLEHADQDGQIIPYRPNTDPLALLGITIKRKDAVAA